MKKQVIMWMCILTLGICGCAKSEEEQTVVRKNTEKEAVTEPLIETVDYGEIFGGTEGCAVIYETSNNTYSFYEEEMCRRPASPWSTFKIAATLMGLHNQVVTSEDSRMGYDGTAYPLEAWNQDLNLKEAFQQSCVWYFRKVIDGVGEEEVRAQLQALDYGNCDSSQWSGSGVNPLPELNGFWLGSSLKISPLQQIEMLRNIVEGRTIYSDKEVETLKNCMLIESDSTQKIYGKTGTGQHEGWFVGFVEKENTVTYIAVYLDDTDSETVNGAGARQIAMEILR